MAGKGFFFCFKSFSLRLSCFFPREFQPEKSVCTGFNSSFILTYLCHCTKNHTFTVSSILLSEYSFLTPYWFSYNLNQELNAFHIWQKILHKKKKKKNPVFVLSFCHNPLLRSLSTPSWDVGEQDDQVTCLELCRQQAMTVNTDVASQKPGQLFVWMQDKEKKV